MVKLLTIRKIKLLLFGLYSYANNIISSALEYFPIPIRNCIFRKMFKKYGKNNFIDYKTYFRYPQKISIGNNVSINRGCNFYASYYCKEAEIIIRDNVIIAPSVSIYTASHDYRDLHLPDIGERVVINDYVWIGGNSIILPGVEVGEGAVVGAGSVVTKDIPPYTVAVGNPAIVMKKRVIGDTHNKGHSES